MKSLRLILMVLFVFYSFALPTFAQDSLNKKDAINKEFWLKTPIPSSGNCKMMISPKGIHTEKEICTFVYNEAPIFSDYKVKIIDFGKRKRWTKVTYKISGSENKITIYLKGNSKKTLAKSFNIVFSKVKYENYGKLELKYGDSRLKLFQSWGFPTSISKNGDLEVYQYGLEFNGIIIGDMATIELKDGKVTSIGVIL